MTFCISNPGAAPGYSADISSPTSPAGDEPVGGFLGGM